MHGVSAHRAYAQSMHHTDSAIKVKRNFNVVSEPGVLSCPTGTIWRGNEVIEGVLQSLELLRQLVGCKRNIVSFWLIHLVHHGQAVSVVCWVYECPADQASCISRACLVWSSLQPCNCS
jgi:hypothetical protein